MKLLILENDEEYARALARQLALSNRDISVTSAAFGRLETDELGKYDLLVAGEGNEEKEVREKGEGKSMYGEEISFFSRNGRCVFLSRGEKGGEQPRYSRYGRVSGLTALLRILYARAEGSRDRIQDFTGKTKLTGFLSGAGGTGKTAAALAYARILSREMQKRVLYLSFETWESASIYAAAPDSEKRLGDYLYYLFSGKEEAAAACLDAFLFQDSCGVCYLYPPAGVNDLCTLSGEELLRFFTVLLRWGEFDEIVLDLPTWLEERQQFLIRSCFALILVRDARPYSRLQCCRLRSWLNRELGFAEESIYEIQPEWEEETFHAGQERIEIDIHKQLGREMVALAQQLAE